MNTLLSDNSNHKVAYIGKDMFRFLFSGGLPSVVVFDLDGTLSDDTARHALAKAGAWHEYTLESINDPPNQEMEDTLRKKFKEMWTVVLTGRLWSPEVEAVTLAWLYKNNLRVDAVIMRAANNFCTNSEYKESWLKNHLTLMSVEHLYDDNPKVIEVCKKMSIPATHIDSGGPGYE